MDSSLKKAIFNAVKKEPFAKIFNIKLLSLNLGYSLVSMKCDPEKMDNIYRRPHGGAVFGLIDEAFETASQTHGTIAVALNINVTYVSSPKPGETLLAEAKEVSRTKKTASYDIKVTDQNKGLIAVCQALAYNTGKPVVFKT